MSTFILFQLFFSLAYAKVEIETISAAPASIVKELPETMTVINDTNKVVNAINADTFDENTLSDDDLAQIESATESVMAKFTIVSSDLDNQEAQSLSEIEKSDRPITFADIVANMKALAFGEAVNTTETIPPLSLEEIGAEKDNNVSESSPSLSDEESNLLSDESSETLAPQSAQNADKEYENVKYEYDVLLPAHIPLFEAISRRYLQKVSTLTEENFAPVVLDEQIHD